MADDPLITFLAARLAEAWSAARDRELAAGLDESAETRMVDALRAIVNRCAEAIRDQGIWGEDGQAALAEDVLRHLASVRNDHPDYRQEWAL
jgi:Family of unknown function (DUF6221)